MCAGLVLAAARVSLGASSARRIVAREAAASAPTKAATAESAGGPRAKAGARRAVAAARRHVALVHVVGSTPKYAERRTRRPRTMQSLPVVVVVPPPRSRSRTTVVVPVAQRFREPAASSSPPAAPGPPRSAVRPIRTPAWPRVAIVAVRIIIIIPVVVLVAQVLRELVGVPAPDRRPPTRRRPCPGPFWSARPASRRHTRRRWPTCTCRRSA